MTKNKRIIIIIVSIFAALVVAFTLLSTLYDDFNLLLWSKTPIDLPEGFTITAHAGCENTVQNSMESIEKGYMVNAQIVEFDINCTENGECVLSHDKPKAGVTYVTLDDALTYVASKDQLKANLDIKCTDYMDKVYESIVSHNLKDRVFFTGIEDKDIATVKTNCPDIGFYLNVRKLCVTKKDINNVVGLVLDSGAIGINLHYAKLTKGLCQACHDNGLLVSVFTPDRMVDISHVLRYSPDNITSRRPTLVIKAIETRKNNK
ncbi:MAG: glycerophosphodiester phosphodiesterase [Clostridia bacterium]|nr:glycerophosphodiester phosphodiesterase [Clostridia bacterium]